MKSTEVKQGSLQKIRFEAKAMFTHKDFNKPEKRYFIRLNELLIENKLLPLMAQRDVALFNDCDTPSWSFPRFEFCSDITKS
jgi:hypothetical protein